MVRFKVVRGSHLLLGFSIAILILVIAAIAVSALFSSDAETSVAQANLVQGQSEAKTEWVFASSAQSNAALELDPANGDSLTIEIIGDETPAPSDAPSVLIYHTHTHEAYEQISGQQYVAIEAWRTTDQDYSVVRVGEELAKLLRARGFDVTHDTTDHEQSDLKTAYTRSLETLESYDERFDLYIDLHRDAYIEGMHETDVYEGSQKLAQLMLLIGNGEGFAAKPYTTQNLAFAEALTERVNALKPELCKEVLVKDGRYNQNIGVFSILVEVGHNRNTLSEALSALPYLSDGIASLMLEDPDPALVAMQHDFQSSH